jgi:hypothetical protein
MCTQSKERPELPPPEYDPPVSPSGTRVRGSPTRRSRDTYSLEYLLSLPMLLFSTSFEVSVIITHFLVRPYHRFHACLVSPCYHRYCRKQEKRQAGRCGLFLYN